jgi:hypothetical protein
MDTKFKVNTEDKIAISIVVILLLILLFFTTVQIIATDDLKTIPTLTGWQKLETASFNKQVDCYNRGSLYFGNTLIPKSLDMAYYYASDGQAISLYTLPLGKTYIRYSKPILYLNRYVLVCEQ